jgi:hypothetical protein
MTPKAKAALEWFVKHGPIGWFGTDNGPSVSMRRNLEKQGLIEPIKPKNGFGLLKFQISQAGRNALAQE